MQTPRDNQPTFFDLAVLQRGGTNRVLETITREVDFSQAEARVSATYSHGGRPACRAGVLLRVMILQHLYGLSDPQAEERPALVKRQMPTRATPANPAKATTATKPTSAATVNTNWSAPPSLVRPTPTTQTCSRK